ncbi:hypothetical protein KSS87_016413 [Heliosperma pusillum]|nr:hypothetical protein KSS87_016413 [Heliosperma pusillum]
MGNLTIARTSPIFQAPLVLEEVPKKKSVRDKCIYRLIGVVEHSGSMRSGHYVAYVRGTDTRQGSLEEKNHTRRHNVWYHASDAYVRETTLNEVLHSEAYILFYEKVRLEEHSGSMKGGLYAAYMRGTDTCRGRSEQENHTKKHNVWYHASDGVFSLNNLERSPSL